MMSGDECSASEDEYPPSDVDEYSTDCSMSSSEEEDDMHAGFEPGDNSNRTATTVRKATDLPLQVHKIKYSGTPGLRVELEPTPIAYFRHFLDDAFLSSICEATNARATAASAGTDAWPPLTLPELKVFIAIFQMDIDLNYGNDWLQFQPAYYCKFTPHMNAARYKEILKRLHFAAERTESYDMAVISGVVQYFNEKMEASHSPGRELWVPNGVCVYRRLLRCRESMLRRGVSLHGVTLDVLWASGVAQRLVVTAGMLDLNRAGRRLTEHVVMALVGPYLDAGYSLYLHPFFGEPSLASTLAKRGTLCTGVLSKSFKEETALTRDGIVMGPLGLKGSGRTGYFTTEFEHQMVKKDGKSLPEAVASHMRVTRKDRREELLRLVNREDGLRWYQLQFFYILRLLLENSHCLYNQNCGGKNMELEEFTLGVSLALLPDGLPPATWARQL